MTRLREERVLIPVKDATVTGDLSVPPDPIGVVVSAHEGMESGERSQERAVTARLHDSGFATVFVDLLTPLEAERFSNRFDLDLLTERLFAVTEWVRTRAETASLPLGFLGSGVAAAATLRAASRLGDGVSSVVSRGGRVDLAVEYLSAVDVPTLFVVGGADLPLLELNRAAFAHLDCEKTLEIVPEAGHRFEGPGEIASVAEVAAEWFVTHLRDRDVKLEEYS
jgi:dienelactone hydrolase